MSALTRTNAPLISISTRCVFAACGSVSAWRSILAARRVAARRHAKSCDGVMSSERASAEMFVPGSRDAAIARSLKSSDQRRRSPTGAPSRRSALTSMNWFGLVLRIGVNTDVAIHVQPLPLPRTAPPEWRRLNAYFLCNHADGIASMDLFVVPTFSFKLLYGLLILQHGRRQMLWLGVTTHPTAEWIARQLTEACGWDRTPRYLIRDRDGVYGEIFKRRLGAMGIRDRPTAPRSPWQNGYAERLIGSIRRECLEWHVSFVPVHADVDGWRGRHSFKLAVKLAAIFSV